MPWMKKLPCCTRYPEKLQAKVRDWLSETASPDDLSHQYHPHLSMLSIRSATHGVLEPQAVCCPQAGLACGVGPLPSPCTLTQAVPLAHPQHLALAVPSCCSPSSPLLRILHSTSHPVPIEDNGLCHPQAVHLLPCGLLGVLPPLVYPPKCLQCCRTTTRLSEA